MPNMVSIRGDGLAAACCAQLLRAAGLGVVFQRPGKRRGNVILLSESSQKLLIDLFSDPYLLSGARRLRNRIVRWGKSTDVTAVSHSALVVKEDELLERLWQHVGAPDLLRGQEAEWEIVAVSDRQRQYEERACGIQVATMYEVSLCKGASEDTCWMESVEDGWLFLFSVGDGTARLISVGAMAASLLAQSELIAAIVDGISDEIASFASYPRIAIPLCGPGWAACGSAAMAFDPICGEGAGNAAREAILASALVRAALSGHNQSELLSHYSSRLIRGFLRHLGMCAQFYETGGVSTFWTTALGAVREGLGWGARQPIAAPRFRLVDYTLEPLPDYRE